MKLIIFTSLILLISFYNVFSQCDCAYVTPDSKYVEIAFVGKVVNIS